MPRSMAGKFKVSAPGRLMCKNRTYALQVDFHQGPKVFKFLHRDWPGLRLAGIIDKDAKN